MLFFATKWIMARIVEWIKKNQVNERPEDKVEDNNEEVVISNNNEEGVTVTQSVLVNVDATVNKEAIVEPVIQQLLSL